MSATRHAAAFVLALAVVTRADVQTYVIVVDDNKRPVIGLSTEDFYLREGGLRLGLLDARPATEPLALAVVVDGFGPLDRAALVSALADATARLHSASASHRISLLDTTLGTGPAIVDLTTDRARLAAALEHVIVTAPPGSPSRPLLIDAILDVGDALRVADTDRRNVLAILKRRAGDGVVEQPSRLTGALLRDHISLWTIEVGAVQTSPLDKALTEAAANGGALREIVAATASLPAAATHVVDLLTAQYVVTYRWPNPMLSNAFYITTRHERGAVLATAWTR